MKKISTLTADMLLLIVALCWGSGFVITKYALSGMTANYLLSLRFIFALIALVIIYFKRLKNINKKVLIGGLVTGLFLTLGFIFQTYGMEYTTVGKASFITGLNIVCVPFIYLVVQKKKPDALSIIAVFIAAIGMAFLTLDFKNIFTFNIGDFLVLICAVCFACQIVSTGYFAKDNDVILLSIIQITVAAVIMSFITGLKEGVHLNIPLVPLLSTVYLALLCTALAFVLQTLGQKYTSATHAALVLCTESVFGSVFAVIFLKEIMTPIMILGCFIILIAIITAETGWAFIFPSKKDKI